MRAGVQEYMRRTRMTIGSCWDCRPREAHAVWHHRLVRISPFPFMSFRVIRMAEIQEEQYGKA